MSWDWNEILTLAGVFAGTAAAAYFGYKQRSALSKPSDQKQVEVVGALVDATSVRMLSSSVEALTMQLMKLGQDGERSRKVAHELVEAVHDLLKEIEEHRRATYEVAKEIARMK